MIKFNRRNKRLVIPVGINPNYGSDVSTLYNTTDADVEANDIIEGKTAYGSEGKITGTLNIEDVKTESFENGYAAGQEYGYENGYSSGKEDGYNEGITEQKSKLESINITANGSYSREDGYNEIIVDVPDLNGDYNEGLEEGKEIGRAEIIEGMNDATITAGTVFKGEVGYGKEGERIVGDFEFVEGFDFGKIGYSQVESNELNRGTAEAIDYSKTLMDEWEPNNTSAYNYFGNDNNLVYAPVIDTSNVTNMERMFYTCPNLKYIPNYNYDNVINIIRFCSYSGNETLNLNLKVCANASMIASYNKSLKEATLDFNNTECNCYGLFYDCENLETATLKNVTATDSRSIFQECDNLTSVNFDNVVLNSDVSQLFYYCQSLKSVPLFDTSNVTNMTYMFNNCSRLTSVPQFNTSNVTRMSNMFYYCQSLTSVPLFDTSNVASMNNMFYNCQSLTSVPLFDTSNVTSTYNMFYSCSALETLEGFINLGKKFKKTGPTDHIINFASASKLTRQSCLNVFNNIYDMNLNEYGVTDATIQLSSATKALLSDEDIAIATSKGWTIA